jgi:hypothetical protein
VDRRPEEVCVAVPLFIRHRVNRAADLATLPAAWGVEMDVRSVIGEPGALVVTHDPWTAGDRLEDWLAAWRAAGLRGPVWFNTKEDGLEARVLELAAAYGVGEPVFLDTTMPTLIRSTRGPGVAPFAVRVSRFEPPSAALAFAGKAPWVWVDHFDGVPFTPEEIAPLVGRFRICLASPELHGFGIDTIPAYRALAACADAVCTKVPEAWA